MISKESFNETYDNLIQLTIPEPYKSSLDKRQIISTLFRNTDKVSHKYLINYVSSFLDEPSCQLVRRVGLIYEIDCWNDSNKEVTPKEIWPSLYSSIKYFSNSPLTASIGSQAFLSVPLYRTNQSQDVKIIRLHIWSTKFKHLIDSDNSEAFSIHSHLFHAQSHIVCGSIYNTTCEVKECSKNSEGSIYKIEWSKIQNEISDNSLKSELVNTKREVTLSRGDLEIYSKGDSYEIEAGNFHKSGYDESQDVAATLFTFNSIKSQVKTSKVVGPLDLEKAPPINYEDVEIAGILNEIGEKINHG